MKKFIKFLRQNLFTRLKKKIEKSEVEKVRFIKVNELKLTQVELFSFFHFMYAAANCFVWPI